VDCVICARWRGERPDEAPVGDYVYEDEHWYAYHAPVAKAVVGQLFLVSKRHFLDFAEITTEEAASYGLALRELYAAMKQAIPAECVYALVTLEGVPHFHVWLIPRPTDAEVHGWRFITAEHSCSEVEARGVVAKLRAGPASPPSAAADTPSPFRRNGEGDRG
jgi:diadenosine tetraphosphate (Ap4A) HIT family hydrolase